MSAREVTDHPNSRRARGGTAAAIFGAALLIDAVLVIIFAATGRSSHQESMSLAGVFDTAWPFLVALAISWVVSFAWRHPLAVLSSGLPFWLGTVILGLIIRVTLGGQTAALPFVIVATVVLGLFLVGWRLIWWLVRRSRDRARLRVRSDEADAAL